MANDTQNIEKYVISMRRYFHEYPELSFQEEQTIERVKDELEEMGLKPQIIEKGGLYADIKGSMEGKTVALRADMDALPIREENDFSFRSKNDGVMHACGHDAHMAMLLGVAKSLVQKRDQFKGTIRLLFQRAEEQPPGGAIGMINGGALKNVDFVIGQHVMSNSPSGTVAIFPSECMANADEFRIKISSKGGHGAYPHTAVDTLMIASLFVVQAQTIVSRLLDPTEPAVITVGSMESGFRYNVISPHTDLRGTVRTFSETAREKSEKFLKNIIQNLCQTYGAEFEFEFLRGYPALINSPQISTIVESVARRIVGEKNIIHPKPSMGGEDFAYYTQKVPGSFYFLGVTNKSEQNPGQNHSPQFTVDEGALGKGTQLLEEIAIKLLAN
jgi:amidohydrolase